MMVRGILLFFSAALCVASSLTAFKAPSLSAWKLAILVGEYGHWFWFLPVLLSGAAWYVAAPGSGWRYATCILSAAALGFLMKPTVQAMQVAATLRDRLTKEFGAANLAGSPFSLQRLFFSGEAKTPVRRETKVFAHANTDSALSLDFYYAVAPKQGLAPCVLVIHGGGWDGGDRHQFESFNEHLARRGFAVAAMDYRLAPRFRWPAQREDGEAALTYLQDHRAALGIDPARIVVFGRSAGGQIAESLAYDRPSSAIRGVISFYAPADLYFAWHYTREDDLLNSFLLMRQYLGGSPEEVPAAFAGASPYLHVGSRPVPTLLGHGKIDALVWHRQSERLAARLEEAQAPVLLLDLPWATHAFDYNSHGPSGQLSAYAIEWFLRTATN